MKPKETLEKAYGSIPKEVGIVIDIDLPRGFRYYWLKAVRWISGR
jgi:hypothetical protein